MFFDFDVQNLSLHFDTDTCLRNLQWFVPIVFQTSGILQVKNVLVQCIHHTIMMHMHAYLFLMLLEKLPTRT